MTLLAKLSSVVLIVLGLVFVYHDVSVAISQSFPNWIDIIYRDTMWRWGLGSIAAGVICAALITIAEAMRSSLPVPPASEPPSQPAKPA